MLVGLRDYQDEKADVILKCELRVAAVLVTPCNAVSRAQPVQSADLPASRRGLRRYMADEARSLKAYGELPENSAPSC